MIATGDKSLAGSKYLWLYSAENLPERQQDRFAALRTGDLKTARAWAPLVPAGPSVHRMVTGTTPRPAASLPQRAAALIAAQFDAGARSVAEKLGIRYVYVSHQPVTLPSPHHPPQAIRAGHCHRT